MQIPAKLRFEVLHRDGFTCQYCGRKAPDVRIEVDHMKPRCEGGLTVSANLITACLPCNAGKGIGYTSDEREMSALSKGSEDPGVLRQLLRSGRVPGPKRGELAVIRKQRKGIAKKAGWKKAEAVLNEGELCVVILAQRGLTNAEIAKERGSHVQTIKNHLTAIFRKLNIRNRTELAKFR